MRQHRLWATEPMIEALFSTPFSARNPPPDSSFRRATEPCPGQWQRLPKPGGICTFVRSMNMGACTGKRPPATIGVRSSKRRLERRIVRWNRRPIPRAGGSRPSRAAEGGMPSSIRIRLSARPRRREGRHHHARTRGRTCRRHRHEGRTRVTLALAHSQRLSLQKNAAGERTRSAPYQRGARRVGRHATATHAA